jgi:hypothetical protein
MTFATTTLRPSRRSITRLLIALLALACAGAAQARAASGPTIDKSPLLWATINVCDTAKHPDTIGIRASMPGSGKAHEKMYMRFRVQYFDALKKKWKYILTADSSFLSVGSARYRRRETGRDFAITPPPVGQEFMLRGVVTFEWRKGKVVVRRAQKRTRSGHKGTIGADPKSFSAATCTIKADEEMP